MLRKIKNSKKKYFRNLWVFLFITTLFLAGCERPQFLEKSLEKLGWDKESQHYSEEKIKILTQSYSDLSEEIAGLKQKLENQKDQTEEKIKEIKNRMNQAQEAYEETKKALEDLESASNKFKSAVTP